MTNALKLFDLQKPIIMKFYQKILLAMLLFVGMQTQMQAQCTLQGQVYPDSLNCPTTALYASVWSGVAPYSFQWSNGATGSYVDSLSPGTYAVTMTDASGCTLTDSYVIQNISPINATYNITMANCGQNNGMIDLFVAGGSGSYYYYWYDNNGNIIGYNQDLNNIGQGVYHVYVYDSLNTCNTQIMNITVGSSAAVTASIIPDSINCPAAYMAAMGYGGVAPYTYLWNDGNSSQVYTGAIPGVSYSVTITDANGCFDVATYYVDTTCGQQNCTMQVSIFDSLNCPDIFLYSTVSGGTAPYSYSWSNGDTFFMTTATTPAFYTLFVTDANGCVDSSNYYVNANTCGQSCNVQAQIFPDTSGCPVNALYTYGSNGSAPYSYQWSNGATTSWVGNLSAGTYSVTVTDALGCQTVDSYTIQNVAPLVASANPTMASCGTNNGVIDLVVTGGSGSYNFTWYDGQWNVIANTEDVNNLAPGVYQVYINDTVYGCFTQTAVTIGSVGGSIATNVNNASCNQANGSATVTFTGFNNPSIQWSNGSTTPTVSGLAQGWYAVTVSDSLCSATDSLYVGSTGQLWAMLWNTGCGPDTLQAYVSGGAAPYTFDWSTGASNTGNDPFDYEWGGAAGTYSVTISDANGCSEVASITVGAPMNVTYAIQDASCAGNDGAINLTVTGGDGMYMFGWSNQQWTEDVSGLTPGVYSVQVYDSSGCYQYIDSLVVGGGGNAFVNSYTIPANCADSAGGVVQVVTGLNNPSYIWSDGSTAANLNNAGSGWYGCTISDNSGCTLVRNYYVDQDSSCYLTIAGYVYNVSLSNTCSPSGATPVSYTMVTLQPIGLTTFTDINGFYDFSVATPGNYTVEFTNASGFYTQLCPSGNIAVNGTVAGGYYGNNNFYITSPNAQDLSVDLSHYTTATPGFGLWTTLQFCNDGQVTMSGTIDYVYDAQLTYDQIWAITGAGSTVFTGHNAANNLLTFSFSNLAPGQCGNIYVDLMTPTTVPLGNIVGNAATIYPLNGDATPANNIDVDTLTVIGSWDPNEKLAGPLRAGDERGAGVIYSGDNTLEYTIHFQNLGTAPAYRVEVRDTLEMDLLPETIREIQASHNVQVELKEGNILVFSFENINLPHASFDEHGSNGFVKFTIDRIAGLPLGTTIDNNAAIYFDFNAPVITNMTEVTISDPTSIQTTEAGALEATVYPNPFQEVLTVEYELAVDTEVTIAMHDALGRLVRTYQVDQALNAGSHNLQINTGELVPAVYYLSIETPEGRIMQKVVKQ